MRLQSARTCHPISRVIRALQKALCAWSRVNVHKANKEVSVDVVPVEGLLCQCTKTMRIAGWNVSEEVY
ncbi:hypothetical protein MTO96_050059 [Rhipicephalus appendiculatus]